MGASPSIIMLGATGAVGGETVKALLQAPQMARLTLLGRNPVAGLQDKRVEQAKIDIFDPETYAGKVQGHDVAVCTLGVGEPSKTSREHYAKVDRDAVLAFARACKKADVRRFTLLSSVGANSGSGSFYLRVKGELEDGLKALGFEGLDLFHPSMILTPTNRYGISQAVVLKIWPWLDPVLRGPLKKFRGIRVAELGAAIANASLQGRAGTHVMEWPQIKDLSDRR